VWEKRIFHPGLKAFRIVRGNDKATVEFKAQLQMEAWNDRWQKLQQSTARKAKEEAAAHISFQKKSLALNRTREAEEQMNALSRILRDGIEIDHVLDWEQLKNRSEFSEPSPEAPKPTFGSPAPQQDSLMFSTHLTLIDRLIPSRRARRFADSERRYLNAKAEWIVQEQQIREINSKQQTEHESKLKEWISR